MNKKLVEALKSISVYIENMKAIGSPKTLEAAEHMLAVISVIASETLADVPEAA